jgi:hypothetical protein
MAINQTALNVEVINGKENFTYFQNLTITSTIAALIISSKTTLLELLSSAVSSISSLFKGNFKTLIVAQPAFDGTSPLNGMALNVSAINATSPRAVSSNVSLITNYFFYKIFTVTSTVLSSIVRVITNPNTFLVTVTSNSSIMKDISLTFATVVSTVLSTLSYAIEFVRTLSSSVSNSVTLTFIRLYYRTLTAVSTVVASVLKSVQKLLTISVNCGIILSKTVIKLMNSLSTVLTTLITSAISFTRYPVNRLIYAATKIRKIFYN